MSADRPFQVFADLEVFEKADDPQGNTMRIGGIVSTAHLDKQDEQIIQQGLDFTPFLTEGWYNDNHGQRATDVLGYPVSAKFVTKGEITPAGRPAKSTGWYTSGYLVNTPEARKLYAIAQSLDKSPSGRRLGFSIEGSVQKRRDGAPNVIERAVVRNVAITHCPVNPHTSLEVLAKALSAGSAISSGDLNQGPGDGGALRTESLEGSPNEPRRRRRKRHDDGLAVQEFELVKADAPELGVEPISEAAYIAGWYPALHALVAGVRDEPPPPLTKAEAEIIIRHRLPGISDREVRQIILHAGGR